MRQIHLCDPQLHDQGGHYLSHDAQLVRDLQRRGLPVRLYGRVGATVDCEGVTPAPVFSHDLFQEVARDPLVWAVENFHAVNQAFLADLGRIDPGGFTADDLVYFPNLLQNQLHAVALWLGQLPAARRPAVAVMLRYLNHAMDYVQGRANKDLIALYYRFAARALAAVQPRTVLCSDTRELAAAYQQITGLPVLELPNPMDLSDRPAPVPAAGAPAAPTLVYLGHTSALRGLQFLPEIIERCTSLTPRPRFIVQVQDRAAAARGPLAPALQRLEQMAARTPERVRLVAGPLPAADYQALLQAADLVLLPYSPTFYGHGSSGVFTEAASLAKVIVVSPDTVPARQGREYGLGVVTAAAWTALAMAEAVAAALRDRVGLQAKAAAAAPRFRSEQCARALWDQLLAALPPAPEASPAPLPA
ncbi:MAG: hypothetical protein NT173_06530 [Opitutales bacterium]|nr:hypothetical protein [Opitutales bacterium]